MMLFDYSLIEGKEIDLFLASRNEGNIETGRSPEYKFEIRLHGQDERIGHINLRLGTSEKVIKYIGHIGYGVNESYRGHQYAYQACLLIKKVILDHDIKSVIITCNPDNVPSYKTCEKIGAIYLNTVDVPVHLDCYSEDEAQKMRYEWHVTI